MRSKLAKLTVLGALMTSSALAGGGETSTSYLYMGKDWKDACANVS